jgi:urea transport system permease protein
VASSGHAARDDIVSGLCSGANGQRAAITRLVEVGVTGPADVRAWAERVVASVRAAALVCPEEGRPALLADDRAVDAASLESMDTAPAGSPLVPSIVMMRQLAIAAAELALFSPDLEARRAAAIQIDKAFAAIDTVIVGHAVAQERDADVRDRIQLALAKRGLYSADRAERLHAIEVIATAPSEAMRTLLTNFLAENGKSLDMDTVSAAQRAIRGIDSSLRVGHAAAVVFSGISYAGVLLLTALGLSIVFGLLGVINLAHGEFIMLGAYTTFFVERLLQAWAPPGWFDAYVFLAVPVAFLSCGFAGMLLEATVIRFLYRRPLETLLATWAVSIALVKLIQLAVGTQNLEFIPPSYLNGGVQLAAGFFITWNRVFAIVLALAIFALAYSLIRHTRFGLLVRATTQRRDTARALGVAAERVDRLAFGLGAGLAGMAGVVLTQISSVNPSMGTSFVVDAFMVVVLGGAGSLAGTAVASLVLGEINQIIEPVYGAVAAKVTVLVLIVLIIQRRPQGLFQVKTRS